MDIGGVSQDTLTNLQTLGGLTALLGVTTVCLAPIIGTAASYVFAEDCGFKNGKDAVKAFWKSACKVDVRDYFKLSEEEFNIKYSHLNLDRYMGC